MIHTVAGTIVTHRKQAISFAIGPIGIECFVPDESLFPIGSQKTIHLHLHWNQEQGPSLYGFSTEADKTIFLLATGCSGVGPRLGLAILADLGGSGFIEAVQTGNEKLLSQVSGIGAKKAEQMIVQLKHKVQQMIDSGVTPVGADAGHFQTVTDALRALNYSRSEVTKALEFVRGKNTGNSQTFDQLMRQALSYLSKQPN
jgi:Holliday junction DNA helicase RuvA